MASGKPCPGCGEVAKHRMATEVCSVCKDLIAKGKLYGELIEKPDLEPLRIPAVAHLYPIADDDFRKSFDKLVRQTGIPAEPEGPYGGFPFSGNCGGGFGFDHFTVKSGTTEALRQVYDSAVVWAGRARAKGHSEGRDLLRGLASGKILMSEFNRLTARRENV